MKNMMLGLKDSCLMAFFGTCQHRSNYSQTLAFLYCLTLSTAYVGALYFLVPAKIRKLDRDCRRHIQYRILASLVVCVAAIASYPLFFCISTTESSKFTVAELVFSARMRPVLGTLMHTMVLYTGSFVTGFFRVFENWEKAVARGDEEASLVEEIFHQTIQPTITSFVSPKRRRERWILIRNLIIAPWTEEIVFRGCMVPALLGADMSPLRVSLVAPLCFGVAHAHHAMTRLSKGERLQPVLFITAFQFVYTSLFGSYAAYSYIRTGSVTAVTISHAFCNWMGLPDFNFVQPNHPIFEHRRVILASFFLGVFGFKWGFSTGLFLPLPAELPSMIQG